QVFKDPTIALQMRLGRMIGDRPSRIVQLLNVAKIDDLLCEDNTQELLGEVRKEAEQYGLVEDIIAVLHRQDGRAIHTDPGNAKVFIMYSDTTSARLARMAFNGRTFDGRVVCAAFYPLLPFQLKQYSLLLC